MPHKVGRNWMHFGGLCDNGGSHVMCACAIGRALERRGHRFTLFALPHLAKWIDKEEISCSYLPHSPFLAERLERAGNRVRSSSGESVNSKVYDVERLLQDLPAKLEGSDIDCLVVDGNLFAAGSVAQSLSLPFATLHCALPTHAEPGVAPIFLPWGYQQTPWGRLRNQAAHRVLRHLSRPIVERINRFRGSKGLAPIRQLSDTFSPFAEITQMVRAFDFPRTQLPDTVHYVGTYSRERKEDVPFPFDRLDGRRLVFASLGTIFGTDPRLWTSIAEACAPLDVQLVIALGSRDASLGLTSLPGNPIVVPFAPQMALLSRASVFITHAGINSVLESLHMGVPMLAIPCMWDQIGLASRIVYRGVGVSLRPEKCGADVLRKLLCRLLEEPAFRENAAKLATIVRQSGGADEAARIIEQVGQTNAPVRQSPPA